MAARMRQPAAGKDSLRSRPPKAAPLWHDGVSDMDNWTIEFVEAAQKELDKLPKLLRGKFLALFDRVEDSSPFELGVGKSRLLRGKIWEFRIHDGRVLFALEKHQLVLLLVCFVKKTQKTPLNELEKAESRYRLWREQYENNSI